MKLKVSSYQTLNKTDSHNISEYKIPDSIILFLKEKFNKDTSLEILKYFIYYLKETKNINLLDWYLEDLNEIKVRLSLKDNKNIQYNKQYEDILIQLFSKIIGENYDNIQLINDYIDEFHLISEYSSYIDKFKYFQSLLENIKKEEEDESLYDILLSEKKIC